MNEFVRSHQLPCYFALAYAISWALWLPLIATRQEWWSVDLPAWWHYLGAAGPVSAALLVTATSEGRAGLRELARQYSPWKVHWSWLAFAVLSPLILLAGALVTAKLADGRWPTYDEIARTSNLPALGLPLTLLAHILTFGVGEETGWRGFALPRLQVRWSAIHATNVLWAFWAAWHIPAFFENPSMMSSGVVEIIGWFAALWMGAIFLTWLYNSSQGSLLVVLIWHGLFNVFSASEASDLVAAAISMGVIAIAITILFLAGPGELRGLSRRAGKRQQHRSILARRGIDRMSLS
jgi:membrane protease YdiL (CAAX protease family)